MPTCKHAIVTAIVRAIRTQSSIAFFPLFSLFPCSQKLSQSSRSRRSTRILGLVISTFLLCWLPFFLNALIAPFLTHGSGGGSSGGSGGGSGDGSGGNVGGSHQLPPFIVSFLLWLGYFNSTLNPFIYAACHDELRVHFTRILNCRCRS